MSRKLSIFLVVLSSLLLFSLIGIAQAQTTVTYWLWDANQLPAYEACAAAFSEANPDIQIEISQFGWGDYWDTLQTGFVAGNAPDVFTNHLAKYPEFVANGLLVDIQPLVERDNVPTDIYIGDLAELWTRDGARYGLPKDWDTIAVVYNVAMFEEAGIDPSIMETWTWNPDDGGEFEQVIRQLTIDANGNNALSEDFDPNNVVQFGFIGGPDLGGFAGQTEWSHWAASNGFAFTNGLWGDQYFYDDPALAETLSWFRSLWQEGLMPPPSESTLGRQALFSAGEGAMGTDGSWMIGSYVSSSDFEVGFGLLPIGPEGRKSMFNGLADSIWVGSDNQEEAWEWVKFLASPECQNIVGDTGVVFPAIPEATERSLAVRAEAGIDVSAFTEEALDPEGTFLFPITDHGAEIATIMTQAMDEIAFTEGDVDVATILAEANSEVNSLFE